jgi:hypothetical protein
MTRHKTAVRYAVIVIGVLIMALYSALYFAWHLPVFPTL